MMERSTTIASSLIISAAAAAAVDEKLEYLNRVATSTKHLLTYRQCWFHFEISSEDKLSRLIKPPCTVSVPASAVQESTGYIIRPSLPKFSLVG